MNGGLFTENELDTKHDFLVTDNRFEQIFKVLESYNFTIAEDSPLDQEVAVDPEVIGKVYESLVNISEEADERGDAGIFYTPRTEIDLMCRLALVDHLSNHLGNENRSFLYQLIFSLEPEEKADADKAFSDVKLWPALNHRLHEMTILDPACGSGSFLVGMLHILDDLQERANRHLKVKETPYDRKKRIIGQSLYGVDVMDWACHVAELRLWLALVVDAELTSEELHIRREPLLPHFTFKIRSGDSLVQEIGGINFGHIRVAQDIPKEIQGRITKLKTEKLKFYDNDPNCQFKSPDQVKREELRLFQDILDVRRHKVQEEIKSLRRKIEGPIQRQIRLDGKIEGKPQQIELDSVKWQKQIEILSGDLSRIDSAREALKPKAEIPFVWDIAFVEIFESEKEGFDIVIGNPPYVRQENIADPRLSREAVTTENKREYKAKLARSVYQAFPNFFGYRAETDTAAHKLDAKSDLYIYFYFHGLSLLNPKGSFCFITSNSWLDVGYGKDLQEFLLKHCHIKMVLDNQAKRSFAQADVNTVIVLFTSPDDHRDWALEKTARFVMFKVPFEHILSPIIFDEIEGTSDRKTTPEYRIFPIVQKTLFEEGWEWPEGTTEEMIERFGFSLKGSKYGGNKWGGKYLRAPDIYWTILEKGKSKLVRVGKIAKVRRGFTTGADDWFYLTKEKAKLLGIEKEYLQPVLTDPGDRNVEGIIVTGKQADMFVIQIRKDKPQLKGTHILDWIARGETEAFKGRGSSSSIPAQRPTVKGRKHWYELPERTPSPVLWIEVKKRRSFTILNKARLLADRSFYDMVPNQLDPELFCALLNSTTTALFCEVQGNAPGGSGAGVQMTTDEVRRLLTVDAALLTGRQKEKLLSAFVKMCNRPIAPVYDEVSKADRHILDSIVFDVLALNQDERHPIYIAVTNLVRDRLKKAESLRSTKKSKGLEMDEQ